MCSNQCRPNPCGHTKTTKANCATDKGEIWSFAIRKYISQSKPCDKRTVHRGVKFLLWVLLNRQDVCWGDTAFTYGSLFVAPNFFSEEFAPVGSLEAGCRLWAGSFFF